MQIRRQRRQEVAASVQPGETNTDLIRKLGKPDYLEIVAKGAAIPSARFAGTRYRDRDLENQPPSWVWRWTFGQIQVRTYRGRVFEVWQLVDHDFPTCLAANPAIGPNGPPKRIIVTTPY
jgi:hypothetical protein